MDGYFCLDGSTTQVFSVARNSFVPLPDLAYSAWVAAGNVTNPLSGNDAILFQIEHLQQSITDRMKLEAATGSANTFKAGTTYAGQTALQVMTTIRAQIDALRVQLV